MDSESALTWEEARKIADSVVFKKTGKHLTDLEVRVLKGSWNGKSYEEMAAEYGYSGDTIRGEIGFKLWRKLTEALEEGVSKRNFQEPLRREWEKQQQQGISAHSLSVPTPEPQNAFYVERPPIESECYKSIDQPGALIRIKAPQKMGKTWLMHRILAYAARQNYHTVLLNLRQVEKAVSGNLNEFLRWFCSRSSRLLQLEDQVEQYWNRPYGSNDKCTSYFEEYLLPNIDAPLVLALDNVDRIFKYKDVTPDFLGLLRSWYEDANYIEGWKKLRLVLAHSTGDYPTLDATRSPFNVGHAIELPQFNRKQVEELTKKCGLSKESDEGELDVTPLLDMVGGHPYLVYEAFDYLKTHPETQLTELMQTAPTTAGLYENHLRELLENLKQAPELAAAMQQLVADAEPVSLEAGLGFKLHRMGLVHFRGNEAVLSCNLYRLYFREHLGGSS